MQAKRILLSKINWLNEVYALALRRQPSPSRENLQDRLFRTIRSIRFGVRAVIPPSP